METEVMNAVSAADFSLMALFWRATITVKIVMIILVVASVWSWAIIFQKFINYKRAKRNADMFDRAFWSGEPLDKLYERVGDKPKGANERIFVAAMKEWERSYRGEGLISGVQQRIDRSMDVAINKDCLLYTSDAADD